MKVKRLIITALFIMLTGTATADATSDFDSLLQEHWQWRLAQNPLMASRPGDDKRLNVELFRRSLEE